MALGLTIFASVLILSLFRGAKASIIPWRGWSLEWHSASPPVVFNFEETPALVDSNNFNAVQAGDETPDGGESCTAKMRSDVG